MIYVVIVAIFLAFGLIAILRGHTPNAPFRPLTGNLSHRLGERPDAAKTSTGGDSKQYAGFAKLSLDDLENFCTALATKNGLRVLSVEHHQGGECHVLTSFDHPLLRGQVILCAHQAFPSPVVGSEVVIGFSDMVKAERAMKGVFITNGFFSEEVMKLNEGANIELVDVALLARWMKELTPNLLPRT